MSSDLQRELDQYMFYGGAFPNLARGMKDVPMPVTPIQVKHLGRPHRITVKTDNRENLDEIAQASEEDE